MSNIPYVFRWDENPCESLPEYMKALYSVVYNTSNEVADNISKVHGCSVHSLLRKAVNNSHEHVTAPLTNKQ
jgi:hypothetical protein